MGGHEVSVCTHLTHSSEFRIHLTKERTWCCSFCWEPQRKLMQYWMPKRGKTQEELTEESEHMLVTIVWEHIIAGACSLLYLSASCSFSPMCSLSCLLSVTNSPLRLTSNICFKLSIMLQTCLYEWTIIIHEPYFVLSVVLVWQIMEEQNKYKYMYPFLVQLWSSNFCGKYAQTCLFIYYNSLLSFCCFKCRNLILVCLCFITFLFHLFLISKAWLFMVLSLMAMNTKSKWRSSRYALLRVFNYSHFNEKLFLDQVSPNPCFFFSLRLSLLLLFVHCVV